MKFDFRGELFSTIFCFTVGLLVKTGSSLILTRILYPEVFGIIAIVVTIGYALEMVSDLGFAGLIVRHERGLNEVFVNTLWTVRCFRALLIFILLFLSAGVIASLYGEPRIETPLRIYSFYFFVHAFEPMALTLMIRQQRMRILSYIELGCAVLSSTFILLYCYFFRDFHGIIYGILINTGFLLIFGYLYAGAMRPRVVLERATLRELFAFAKYVTPSSILTLLISQFDRMIFLRLFDLRQMGVYGLAGNITGPFDNLIQKLTRSILLARSSEAWLTDRDTTKHEFYRRNINLLGFISFCPAMLAAFAPIIVQIMYDARYQDAAGIIRIFSLRIVLSSLASPIENLLIASGSTRVLLAEGICRILWIVPVSLAGYYFFGFFGFITGICTDYLPVLLVLWYRQQQRGLMLWKCELVRVIFPLVVFGFGMLAASIVAPFVQDLPWIRIKH